MIRKSFLRDIKLEQISIQEWDLPAIGTHQIGFGICPESGLIIQSPSPSPDEINAYYSETATYINPGRKGKPSNCKVKDLNRLINICKDTKDLIFNSIFQVGCSDGYTLSRFRDAGANVVCGVDPSKASHQLASELYNIETIVGTFEDYKETTGSYNLIILTHVLEHLFDPVKTLEKCNAMQNDGDWILIEVPLFERMDCFPPGLLTLEHLNYFSEGTLIETVTKSGYEPVFIGKYFDQNEYPVITITAKKNNNFDVIKSNNYSKLSELLVAYIDGEKQAWERAENKIREKIKKGTSTYIYGAGIHTSQLLAFTDLKEYLNILGLLDSSLTKWGTQIGIFNCYNINEITIKKDDIILISSYASENEIYKSLITSLPKDINIIRIYGG
jgi:hypothetical protein